MLRRIVLMMVFVLWLLAGVVSVSADEGSALVRFAHFAADAPAVDVRVNSVAAAEALEPDAVSEFIEFEPGTLTVDFAADSAISESMAVVAGHRYSVSLIGQAADNSLHLLVIDETEAMQNVDMSRCVFRIIVHNIAGAPPVSFYENGMWLEKNIEYGSYSAACFEPFSWDTGKVVAGEDLDDVIFDFDSQEDKSGGFWEPYTVYFFGMTGHYPGAMFEDYGITGAAPYVVAPTVTDFLSAFSPYDMTGDYQTYYRFDTAVAALKAAGLDEMLSQDGPYTLFIPVDAAFAALPAGTLDGWMKNPEQLKQLLLNHTLAGSYADYGALAAASPLTTLAGEQLEVGDLSEDEASFSLNEDATVASFPYVLADGTVIYFINNRVLMPAD